MYLGFYAKILVSQWCAKHGIYNSYTLALGNMVHSRSGDGAYSSGHLFLEVLGSLSHSKLMALSGHDATDKIN